MPRQSKQQRSLYQEAEAAARRLLDSPLEAIGHSLLSATQLAGDAHGRGELRPEILAQVSEYVITVVQSLPKTFGDRFRFDAGLIRAMASDWGNRQLFSEMIVPSYEKQWGYSRVCVPLTRRGSDSNELRADVIELILLPGSEDLQNVALLDYPWLGHELAHSLMFRFDEILVPCIAPAIDRVVTRRRLAGIADRGGARSVSLKALDEFSGFWTPTLDHRNWAHELTADVIAVWVLGPVYLAAFEDLLSDGDRNPYQISTVHPPYAIRIAALLNAAGKLGAVEHTQELARLFSGHSSRWPNEKTNRYLFLADPEVVAGLVDAAFSFCDQLKLRRWSASDQLPPDQITSVFRGPELGTDLLVTAWRKFAHHGHESYERWESGIVQSIAQSLRR